MNITHTIKKTGKAVEKAFLANPDKQDMDILDKLKQEHEDVRDMLEQLVDNESSSARKLLVKDIKAALIPHLRAEEKVVYDAILQKKDKDVRIDGEEGYYEHHLAENMLTQLLRISNAASPEFAAAAKVLKELVEHHVEEEERNVWADVREYFDDDDRVDMNRQFEAAKKRVRTG